MGKLLKCIAHEQVWWQLPLGIAAGECGPVDQCTAASFSCAPWFGTVWARLCVFQVLVSLKLPPSVVTLASDPTAFFALKSAGSSSGSSCGTPTSASMYVPYTAAAAVDEWASGQGTKDLLHCLADCTQLCTFAWP